MLKSKALITSPDVLDDVNESEIDDKNNKVDNVKDELMSETIPKQKHLKTPCKGCDGICCTKKVE